VTRQREEAAIEEAAIEEAKAGAFAYDAIGESARSNSRSDRG
jgi:hypothetical protein